ncbi:MAG TPA: hypothetical protein VK427_07760 [Kofleriaceae bacterium]|nr:hypothetical protein [Kofleriaceae bacterium]
MAPVAPLGRIRAIQLVLEGSLPIAFGSPHPHTIIVEQGGRFRIRALVVDPRDAPDAWVTNESWMPEHQEALGKPTGKIYAEAKSSSELVDIMRRMSWPEYW